MAYYLMTLSHYPNQCWFMIIEICGIHLGQFHRKYQSSMFHRMLVIKDHHLFKEWLTRLSFNQATKNINSLDPERYDNKPLPELKTKSWPRSISPYGTTRPQWVNWTINDKDHLTTISPKWANNNIGVSSFLVLHLIKQGLGQWEMIFMYNVFFNWLRPYFSMTHDKSKMRFDHIHV